MVSSPERGGIFPVALLLFVAALLAAGAIYLWRGEDLNAPVVPSTDVSAPTTGVVAAPVSVVAPVIEEPVLEIEGEDGEEIAKGELIPFRNQFGEKQYRLRDPIAGVTGDGRPLRWTATLRLGPNRLERRKMGSDFKSKSVKVSPPRFQVDREGRSLRMKKEPGDDASADSEQGDR